LTLIVGSLELVGVFALIAFLLGSLLGLSLILRVRIGPVRAPGEDLSILTDGSLD
jgi:hypothetical protein